ncbi:hypothetical protein C8J57DRAFT_1505549 [Mycena rebaudengoi]|nr:hypothetical protein C8J57DRAFT_1505549 [Mycena rebaudengoi]
MTRPRALRSAAPPCPALHRACQARAHDEDTALLTEVAAYRTWRMAGHDRMGLLHIMPPHAADYHRRISQKEGTVPPCAIDIHRSAYCAWGHLPAVHLPALPFDAFRPQQKHPPEPPHASTQCTSPPVRKYPRPDIPALPSQRGHPAQRLWRHCTRIATRSVVAYRAAPQAALLTFIY